MPTKSLTEVELDAWRGLLRAHAVATRQLEAELTAECDLPLGSYEVLLRLAGAPHRTLRMTELARTALLSRSGLTRLVDRLERDGLIERRPCPSDARGMNATLTNTGYRRLRDAAPTHLRGVREHVTGRLTDDELVTLARLLERIADPAQDEPVCG